MNKKGFTLTELLAVIVILAVVITVAVPTFNKYVLNSEKQYYKSLEKTVRTSGMEFFNENSAFFPKEVGEYAVVNEDELEGSGIIENITDSDGNPCEKVRVIVKKKENGSYEYESCLKCGNYTTNTPICNGNYDGDGTDKTGPSHADIQIVKKTTNSITVEALCKDEQSTITKIEYKMNNGNYITAVDSNSKPAKTYKFDNLEDGKDYKFKVRCTSSGGSRESKTINAVTASFANPTMDEVDNVAEGYPIAGFEYSPKRDIKIIYNSYNIEPEDAEYFFKSTVGITSNVNVNKCTITTTGSDDDLKYSSTCDNTSTKTIEANQWYKTSHLEAITTFATDTYDVTNNAEISYTLFAQIGDGNNLSGISNYQVNKIDVKKPTISYIEKTKILYKEDYDFLDNTISTFGHSNGNTSCSPSTTRKNGKYNVTCTAIGNNGLQSIVSFDVEHIVFIDPNMKEVTNSSYNCAPKRDIEVTYFKSNIANPYYFIKSTVDVKVNETVYSCGDITKNQNSCSKTGGTKSMKANTWYKAPEKIVVTFSANTQNSYHSLYARVGTGKYLYEKTISHNVRKIDNVRPTIQLDKSSMTLNGTSNYSFKSNVKSSSFGYCGGTVSCNPASSRKSGNYNVTCTATGNNGLSASASFTVKHSYPAKLKGYTTPCVKEGMCDECRHADGTNACEGMCGSPGAGERCCSYCVGSVPCCLKYGNKVPVYECDKGGTLKGSTCYY